MKTTRTFRLSGLAVLAGALLTAVPLEPIRVSGIVICVFAVPVFVFAATRLFLQGLLWRVGSRLFVSYLLLLAPVFFVLLFGAAGMFLVAGQLAARRTQTAFERRQAALSAFARDLASRFEQTRDAVRRKALFEELRTADLPDLGYLYTAPGAGPEAGGTPAADALAQPTWTAPSALFFARTKRHIFVVASERRGNATLFVTLPLGPPLRRLLEKETGTAIGFHGVVLTEKKLRDAGSGKKVGFTIDSGAKKIHITDDPDVKGLDPGETETAGRWITFPLFLPSIIDWESGKPLERSPLIILTRSSLEIESRALFGSFRIGRESRTLETHRIVITLMKVLAILTVAAYVLASLVSGLLVYRIARATRRLTTGFTEIEKGNFAHRVVFKGHDQLAALVTSFNAMAANLGANVAERAEKEALEHELSVARDLQRRLLPPADFACPGVGIAVDFAPAAAIGGDFYDLSYSERVLTISLADVSGHGLPTGLVMATAKASLGMLARTGASGVRLMELLHEEIVRTTERRTFVTLAHLVFNLANGTVAFTNAGHPYPYRVGEDGTVEALANPAWPLGLALSGGWHTVSAPLAPGDCWVLFSDGLVEATRVGSDESWGFARLEEVLRAGQAESAAALRDRVLDAQRLFTNRIDTEDDRTLLVLRIEG